MAQHLKIGFILAANEIDIQWYQPLAFGYLKAYLEQALPGKVEMDFLSAAGRIDGYDVIGISSTSQDFHIAQALARTIKASHPHVMTVLGGHHVTYLPGTLPEEFDVGVMGEGEVSFAELAAYFLVNGLRIVPAELRAIPGLVYRDGSTIIINPPRVLIQVMDSIPFPYRPRKSLPYLFSSRGCPYQCAFCSSRAFWRKTRFFSAAYVVREIEHILRQSPGTRHISIWDDLFVADRERLQDIVELIERQRLNRRLTFAFSLRANLVDDDLCRMLKRLHVSSVGFGAESGSDRILNILRKGLSAATNQTALDTLHAHGIPVACSFIVGVPTETEPEVRQTYDFMVSNIIAGKLSPDCPVNILMPMPGTRIWDDAIQRNAIDLAQMEWGRLAVFASYRNSRCRDLEQWIERRRQNNSLYLAEETLPLERLYELMRFYENIIIELLKQTELQRKANIADAVVASGLWSITAPVRFALRLVRRMRHV